MYCDFQYMSQLANLGLYVPKGYIRVPNYHKYWRTHIFIFQNLMPSSFVRSSISSFIISKPKDVGSTPQFTSYQLAFIMPWWVLPWVDQPFNFKYKYSNDYHLQLPLIAPNQEDVVSIFQRLG